MLENRDEIPVGDPDADMNELRAIFGAEKVARSLRVWNMLIQKITSQPIQQEILACRSPQQAWRVFVNHYSTKKGQERYQLETQWSDLHQRETEDVLDYLSRASAIRLKLESYGDTTDDRTMSAHIARHLSDTYERVRDSLPVSYTHLTLPTIYSV